MTRLAPVHTATAKGWPRITYWFTAPAIELLELTHVIALENHRGRFNLALGIGAAGFGAGAACAVPVPAITQHRA